MQPVLQLRMEARIEDLHTDQKTTEGHSIPQDWSKLPTSSPQSVINHERRIGPRTALRYSLVLLNSDGRSIKGETQDIGRNGFACNILEPFGIGEQLSCVLCLGHGESGDTSYLECSVEVVRTALNKNGFVLGTRILDSKIIGTEAVPAWASSLKTNLATTLAV